ncbi:prepilin peptidase [Actinomyces weissii]|uniref:prepilin peptidase n=1 Tax=Actinomyces weissii TaxID=675090 RepID=UPI001F3AB43D|nr:A24 family peptidase [Actinomyces weissii]
MLFPLTLTALVLASTLLAALPASAFARSYVEALSPDVPVRGTRFLDRLPQALLALAATAASAWWVWRTEAGWMGLVALPVIALLGVAASTDAVCHRLPNRLLLAAGAWVTTALVALAIARAVAGAPLPEAVWPLGRGLLSAVATFTVLLVMTMLPSGMGMGDAKLVAVLGLWLGALSPWAVVAGLVLGFFIGGVVALALLAFRLVGRKDVLAFGPYLCCGAWLSWAWAVD